jgi:hypothetical protein
MGDPRGSPISLSRPFDERALIKPVAPSGLSGRSLRSDAAPSAVRRSSRARASSFGVACYRRTYDVTKAPCPFARKGLVRPVSASITGTLAKSGEILSDGGTA